MDVETIIDMIVQPKIRTVSFDIFDTLLERPALRPEDIFVLLNEPVKKLLQRDHFDFHKIRRRIEVEAVRHHSPSDLPAFTLSLEQIYEFFRKKHGLSVAQARQIMEMEQDLERSLLSPRSVGRRLFEAAHAAEKRIICISDMYHGRPFLSHLLTRNGYCGISAIYVSSDIKKRKDSGALFSHVLEAEQLAPHEMIHIGDNSESDYRIPLHMGIPAIHIPSSLQQFLTYGHVDSSIGEKCGSPYERLVIGFLVNRWACRSRPDVSAFADKHEFGYFGIGPILFAIAQSLRMNCAIQRKYSCIHFASRDGHLPRKAYDALNLGTSRSSCLPSNYLHCGRALYHAASYRNNPLEHFKRRLQTMSCGPNMTLGHLFDALMSPGFLPEKDERRNQLVTLEIEQHFPVLTAIVNERYAEIDQDLQEKKRKLEAYYNEALKSDATPKRALVFDCGYNGSVSTQIMKVFKGKVDKAYLCETSKNRLADRVNRTRTHLLLGRLTEVQPASATTILEEVFSSVEGPVIDLARTEDQWTSLSDTTLSPGEYSTRAVLEIQSAAMEFVRDIQTCFEPYMDGLALTNVAFATQPLCSSLQSPTDRSIRLVEQIVFPDPFYGDSRCLSRKADLQDRDHLLRTPFVDPAMTLGKPGIPAPASPPRIGLHIHLYHLDLAPSFYERLAEWPVPLDLYISVCSPSDEHAAQVLFSPLLNRNVTRLCIRCFPNRGRDTASWVAGFGVELSTYDLAGHVHAKRSVHFPWGDPWREYMLDHTISWQAFSDIQAHFLQDSRLGVLFPSAYDGVFEFWGTHHFTHLEEIDRERCQRLLERMRIRTEISKHNTHFSVGTMLWYRPPALKPLMDLGLTFDDFEPEPIGITGSLAHAIERLPGHVAEACGYAVRSFIRQDELMERYHQYRLSAIGAGKRPSHAAITRNNLTHDFSQILILLMPRGTRRYRWARKVARKLHLLQGAS